jgi:signal transduction histidine kinase
MKQASSTMTSQGISTKKPVTYSPQLPKNVEKPLLLTAALTHEVRNPLSNIALAVELLQHLLTSAEQQSYLDIIRRASERITRLVTELAEKQSPHKEELCSLHQLLDEVLIMTEDRIRLKKITVIKDYFKEDHSRLQKGLEIKIALTNIIINAIDAMKEQPCVLKLVTTSVNENYSLVIEDNGCGISPGDMKQIFDPFFTRKKDGLGIGLATTWDILKANNVKIDVESEEGKGTKFILAFTKPVL